MKITLTIERKNKKKIDTEQKNDDVRVSTGFMMNAHAPYTAKSHRAPRTLGFH
jgi:hypothetical protein